MFKAHAENTVSTSSGDTGERHGMMVAQTVKENAAEHVTAVHETLQAKKEDFIATIQQKRDEASAAAQERRDQFKQELSQIRDARKEELVSSISAKITSTNTTDTTKFADALDRLQTILDTISSKSASVKATGVDTSTVDSAVTSAQAAIDSAKAAVSAQAAKTYVLSIPDSTTLKASIGPTVSEFRTDLSTTFKAVIDAKQAVMKAAMELAKVSNQSVMHETSASGSGGSN